MKQKIKLVAVRRRAVHDISGQTLIMELHRREVSMEQIASLLVFADRAELFRIQETGGSIFSIQVERQPTARRKWWKIISRR